MRLRYLPMLMSAWMCLGNLSEAQAEPGLVGRSYAQAWASGGRALYLAPAAPELAAMRTAFERLLRGERTASLLAALQAMGWSVRSESADARVWTVVAEADGHHSGRGLYAFSDRGHHALQAPHVPTDSLTGDILSHYAGREGPRAMAWNTVPRTTIDLAHADDSYFNEFSQAFATVYPDEKIIQVHGFDAGKRHSGTGAESTAIVSSSTKQASRELQRVVECLKARLDPLVQLYGRDVTELGATTNSVARGLRTVGFTGFVHLELSLSLRETLVRDASKRSVLFDCLAPGGIGTTPVPHGRGVWIDR